MQVTLIFVVFLSVNGFAQPCFDPDVCWGKNPTGDNHTIIIPNTATVMVNGCVLPGDSSYIGVFFDDGSSLTCSNYIPWDNSGTALSAFGNDGPPKNGFDTGEKFYFKLLLHTGDIVDSVRVVYVQPPGPPPGLVDATDQYAIDHVSMIDTLQGYLFSSSPKDCNGDCFGSAFIDTCGQCAGGNTGVTPDSCTVVPDCNGVAGGTAYIDSCGNCVGGNTGINPCVQDCGGEWGGSAFIDTCGKCAAGNTGVTPILDADSCNVGIYETNGKQQVRVYPNPFSEEIYVEFEAADNREVELRLLDLLGKDINYTRSVVNGANNLRLVMPKNLVPGIYLLELRLDDSTVYYKLFK